MRWSHWWRWVIHETVLQESTLCCYTLGQWCCCGPLPSSQRCPRNPRNGTLARRRRPCSSPTAHLTPHTGGKDQFSRPVHHKYIARKWTKYHACTHPAHPRYIQNFPCQCSCNLSGLGNVTVVAWNLLLSNQRNSVGVKVGGGGRGRILESNGNAHWVCEWSEGSVVIDTGSVKGEEEISKPVVDEFV